MLDTDTQLELLRLAREGTPVERNRAFDALVADFRGPALAAIHKTLARLGVDGQQAEDALQRALLKFAATGIHQYSGRSKLRTYFVSIGIRCALDLAAEQRIDRPTSFDPAGNDFHDMLILPDTYRLRAVPPEDAEHRLGRAEVCRVLLNCVQRLSPTLRRAVELFYLEERGDCTLCARLLDIAQAAFQQRLCRARRELAACVDRALGGEDERW